MEDIAKLRHLVEHWIEHNEGHLATYREWAGRTPSLGVDGLEDALDGIVEETERTGELLRKMKKLLG